MRRKLISAKDAAALIKDGDVLTTSGFVGIGVPDALLAALKQRFLETGHPKNLSLVFAAGQGDGGDRGLNHLGHEGLLKRVFGGHWGLTPKVAALAVEGKVEGWNLPQGCISQLFRDIAAGKPGMITKVGLETFVDPRNGGGAINDISVEPQVELMTRGGEDFLFYRAPKLTVALLHGTTADETGKVTMECEALIIDNLALAMAVKNAGGIVIVEVERVARGRSLPPRDVQIPGILVDAVVVAPPELHMQSVAPRVVLEKWDDDHGGIKQQELAFDNDQALSPGVRVGTIDKFQGQEVPVCLLSIAASSEGEMPGGMEFLHS